MPVSREAREQYKATCETVLCSLQGMLRNPAEEDIRASILRHADKEGDQFSTFTKAYAKTQPERIFAEEEKDEEGSDKEA